MRMFSANPLEQFTMLVLVESLKRIAAEKRKRMLAGKFVPELFQLNRSFGLAIGP